ncbi:unnamed protein product [Coffea canephora]|uniref:Acetylajmalan esterase-like n=2 Tax=Coffea TaxID=13442 RepID=A0A068UN74_COFCA|nr:unnamed protein product [Coffea canephora]
MAVKGTIVVFFVIASAALLFVSPPPSADAHPLAFCHFDQIYQLGDSISDAGNLIRESPLGAFLPFARAPYGQTLLTHEATGRCSDGLLMIDYIALASGLPLVNPIKDAKASFMHGANFAVAGATALSSATLDRHKVRNPVTNSSLDVQLEWMKDHFHEFCGSQRHCEMKLRNALFMVGEIGGNDYNYAFFSNKRKVEILDFVPQVVASIKKAVEGVIRFGARRIVVPGNFPIGCLPVYLTGFNTDNPDDYDENHCLKGLNSFATLHNSLLKKAISELQKENPQVTIAYGDYYGAFQHLLQIAKSRGFELQRACCGGGGEYNFNQTRMCGYAGATACPDPYRYVSWDGIHMTQEAYHIMVDWLLADFLRKLHCHR